jgi:hypothetical protein
MSRLLAEPLSSMQAEFDDEDDTELEENLSRFLLGHVEVNLTGLECYNGRVSD